MCKPIISGKYIKLIFGEPPVRFGQRKQIKQVVKKNNIGSYSSGQLTIDFPWSVIMYLLSL